MGTVPTSDRLPAATELGRTALRVEDIDTVVAFYRDVVGLTVRHHSPAGVTLGTTDTPLLELLPTHADPTDRGSRAGLYHNAFRVATRGDLGNALVRIRANWSLDCASDHLVSEALYCRDPEDNGVELYCDRPRSSWSVDDDGRVQMDSQPLDLKALAAAARGASRAPVRTTIGHIHLEVISLSAFESFYVDVLGFDKQTTFPGARFVAAGGYHHHVGANTWDHRSEPAAQTKGLAWFEVVLPSATALHNLRDRVEGAGYSTRSIAGGVSVSDPDGIEIRVRPRDD